MTIFDRNTIDMPINRLAHGVMVKGTATNTDAGQLFRLERATPYYRAGVTVKAVPQFRAVNLFSPTSTNSILPTISLTPTQITYPVKVR